MFGWLPWRSWASLRLIGMLALAFGTACLDFEHVGYPVEMSVAEDAASPIDASSLPRNGDMAGPMSDAAGTSADLSVPSPTDGGMPTAELRIRGGTLRLGDRGDMVTIADFFLDTFEVSVSDYAGCGNCDQQGLNVVPECNWGKLGRSNHPMNCVTWTQAVAYCSARGKRLPTEAEWEWAAGGSAVRAYPFGNAAPSANDMPEKLCWSGAISRNNTCAVGSFPSGDSVDGVHDLAGNVWEWTSDCLMPPYDCAGQPSGARAYRGGSWYSLDPTYTRAAYRFGQAPSYRANDLGFRCARN